MKYMLIALFSAVFFIQPISAQKVKLKKGIVSLDKKPTFKIQTLEKLEGTRAKKIVYTAIDNDQDTILIATPKKVNYEKLPFEESDKFSMYYEVSNPKTNEKGIVGQGFLFKKNLTKALVKSKTLTAQGVAIANIKAMDHPSMKVDSSMFDRIAANNKVRKEMLDDPNTLEHMENLKERHPNFETTFDLAEGEIMVGVVKVGNVQRTSNKKPVFTIFTYEINSSTGRKVATATYDLYLKKMELVYFNDPDRPRNYYEGTENRCLQSVFNRLVNIGYL